jgi:hypothetical protein
MVEVRRRIWIPSEVFVDPLCLGDYSSAGYRLREPAFSRAPSQRSSPLLSTSLAVRFDRLPWEETFAYHSQKRLLYFLSRYERHQARIA